MIEPIALPQKPQYVKGDKYAAVFEIKGCHPGYGNTLGNAIRRVLLSSLPGYAVTQVKFSGVDHEFSTIPGVKENVIQILLNIKGLRFVMHSEEQAVVKVKVSGEREVTAADIKAPTGVEVINKDARIATLTSPKAKFELELTVEKGIGYAPVEQREEKSQKEIGLIAIDALFTPIKRVNYVVENMRVGKRTDFDKVTFTIETDGSIRPEDAFKEASKILIRQFVVLAEAEEAQIVQEIQEELEAREGAYEARMAELEDDDEEEFEMKAKDKEEDEEGEISIDDLNLSARIIGILKSNKIETVEKLATMTEEELGNLEGMGEKGIKEIKKAVGAFGLVLGGK